MPLTLIVFLYFQIDKIIFCVFLIKDVSVYQENLQMYFPVEKPTEGNFTLENTTKVIFVLCNPVVIL
jgi:hypothetical protein